MNGIKVRDFLREKLSMQHLCDSVADLLDAMRDAFNYQNQLGKRTPGAPSVAKLDIYLKMFRAQRNLYLAGGALLLLL